MLAICDGVATPNINHLFTKDIINMDYTINIKSPKRQFVDTFIPGKGWLGDHNLGSGIKSADYINK